MKPHDFCASDARRSLSLVTKIAGAPFFLSNLHPTVFGLLMGGKRPGYSLTSQEIERAKPQAAALSKQAPPL